MDNKTIHYTDGWKYRLEAPYEARVAINPPGWIKTPFISLSPSGDLVVAAGYAWDGPSGPTVDTKSAMRGSLTHDALYQLLREGHLPPSARKAADDIYRDLCIEDGMWPIRAWLHFEALRGFGGSAASARSIKPVLVAP